MAELADVISLISAAHAAGSAELADAVWAAGARAIGWVATPTTSRQKNSHARVGPEAAAALAAAAAGAGS